ncbi:MAG: response regulator [Kiritimatiellae bacterium]|nr:response regulator [Kiritimatiellia bacterium]MDD5522570.1 response regulator [Kiritimatiellia bacterium]
MKILIADDEEKLAILFKTILSVKLPGSSIMINRIEETKNTVRKEQYDVLLMDLNMPEKDSCEALFEIEEMCIKENLKKPFIVFCTGLAVSAELENIAADSSNYCMLRKPVTVDKLLSPFKALLPLSRQLESPLFAS